MPRRPSITYWNRVEPSPRGDGLQRGLVADVRDPLWFLTRQWQVGEFQGEDAASPAFANFAARFAPLDRWRPGDAGPRPFDGSAPLEALSQNEATSPDLRTAVELGQLLEGRLATEGAPPLVVEAFRAAFPVPRPADLRPADARDRALVRLALVCGGRATDGIAALRAAASVPAPDLPDELDLPAGGAAPARAALDWLATWTAEHLGPIGRADAGGWRPEHLEYGLEVSAVTPDRDRVTLAARAGPFGELDWYAFDEVARTPLANPGQGPDTMRTSLLPAAVGFAGMPDARWWHFEDARFNWASVDTDRRELGKVLVMDFMLVQGNDWFMVPFAQRVGTLVQVDQLLVRDVFGEWTRVDRADAAGAPGEAGWTMFSTAAADRPTGLAEWFLLPPGALRSTLDGPDLEEVRFVRDEQANLVWAIETTTEDGTGRPWPGRERALDLPDEPSPAPPTTAPLRYRLQTGVPVNWIPFVPVQIDATRRAVALERAAMRRRIDGALRTVRPVGRILNPTNLADRDVYRVREEQIARTGVRLFRADRRTRWTDGSTHLWTSRRRRAAEGEVVSGLKYDLGERTDAE
jgi:hypothetical protein